MKGALGWIFQAFSERAKVRVICKTGSAMSLPGPSDQIMTLRWDFTIVLTNLAKHDALELEVLDTNNPELQRLPEHCVRELGTVEIPVRFSKQVDRAVVREAHADLWGKLEPPEIGQLYLLLSYKNAKGFKSYTHYQRVAGEDHNEYYRRRPRRAV
jgi:hypothetical protein